MKAIIKWLIPIITIGVAIFVVFFFISINSSPDFIKSNHTSSSDEIITKKPKELWLNNFSKGNTSGYVYPVSEVYLEVDLDEKINNTTTYELSASLLDQYQLFCLKEELKRYKLRYNLKNSNNKVELFIYSQNRKKLKSLVKALKDYQIFAKIKRQ